MSNAATIFQPVNLEITEDIRRMLRLQGHYLTGELDRSFKAAIESAGSDTVLTATAAEYLESLEKRTPAEQIRIDNAEFERLKKWVILRGMASFEQEATAVAAAIVRKWHQEGRPTEGSRAFSATGKRTDAVKDTFGANDQKYRKMIDTAITGALDTQLKTIKSGTI